MLNLFEKKSHPLNNIPTPKKKLFNETYDKQYTSVKNNNGETKHYPPSSKNRFNSIYSYNKNFIKTLPLLDKIVNKLIKNYFYLNPMYNKKRFFLYKLKNKIYIFKVADARKNLSSQIKEKVNTNLHTGLVKNKSNTSLNKTTIINANGRKNFKITSLAQALNLRKNKSLSKFSSKRFKNSTRSRLDHPNARKIKANYFINFSKLTKRNPFNWFLLLLPNIYFMLIIFFNIIFVVFFLYYCNKLLNFICILSLLTLVITLFLNWLVYSIHKNKKLSLREKIYFFFKTFKEKPMHILGIVLTIMPLTYILRKSFYSNFEITCYMDWLLGALVLYVPCVLICQFVVLLLTKKLKGESIISKKFLYEWMFNSIFCINLSNLILYLSLFIFWNILFGFVLFSFKNSTIYCDSPQPDYWLGRDIIILEKNVSNKYDNVNTRIYPNLSEMEESVIKLDKHLSKSNLLKKTDFSFSNIKLKNLLEIDTKQLSSLSDTDKLLQFNPNVQDFLEKIEHNGKTFSTSAYKKLLYLHNGRVPINENLTDSWLKARYKNLKIVHIPPYTIGKDVSIKDSFMSMYNRHIELNEELNILTDAFHFYYFKEFELESSFLLWQKRQIAFNFNYIDVALENNEVKNFNSLYAIRNSEVWKEINCAFNLSEHIAPCLKVKFNIFQPDRLLVDYTVDLQAYNEVVENLFVTQLQVLHIETVLNFLDKTPITNTLLEQSTLYLERVLVKIINKKLEFIAEHHSQKYNHFYEILSTNAEQEVLNWPSSQLCRYYLKLYLGNMFVDSPPITYSKPTLNFLGLSLVQEFSLRDYFFVSHADFCWNNYKDGIHKIIHRWKFEYIPRDEPAYRTHDSGLNIARHFAYNPVLERDRPIKHSIQYLARNAFNPELD